MKRFTGLSSAFAVLFYGIVAASAEDGSVSQTGRDAKDAPVVRAQLRETGVRQPSYRRRSAAKRIPYRTAMSPVKLPWAPNAPGD